GLREVIDEPPKLPSESAQGNRFPNSFGGAAMKTRLWISLAFVSLAIFWTFTGVGNLHAQATDSILVGSVTDPTGAFVPDATVTATNKATGVKYTGTTN